MASIVVSNLSQQASFPAGGIVPTVAVAASTTLTTAHSGYVISCSQGGGADRVITLPAPATAGLKFRFVLAATQANAAAHVSITSPTAATMKGIMNSSNGAGNALLVGAAGVGGATTIARFVGNLGAVGDWIEVVSDGTNYYASGQSSATAGVVFA